jgi:ABC-type transport system involved in multi-copper enzyme maturation permease subunit
LLGGVEVQQMVGIICLCIAVALSSAALGMMLSVVVNRAYAVILLAYLIMGIVYMFVPMVTIMYASALGARGAMPYFHFFATYNPFFCAGFMSTGQMKIFVDTWIPCVLTQLAATAVLLFFSALLVRRIARREGDATAAYTPAVPMPPPEIAADGDAQPQAATAAAAEIPIPRVRVNRPVSDNPVLWRELRRPLMVTRAQRAVGTTVILGLLVLTYGAAYANNALHDNDTQIGFSIVFCGLVMVIACVISATAIAQEKEGDTWTILLASPVSGLQIVWAKVIGAARKMLWPMVLIGFHFAAFTVTGVIAPWAFVLAIGVIVLFNTLWLASGIYLSLRCRKVTLAIIINLSLPVVLYGVFSLGLAVLDEFGNLHGDLVSQVFWYLPFYYLGEGMSGAGGHRSIHLPGSSRTQVDGVAFTAIAITMGLLHVGVALAILSWTAARFNEIVGRAPQLVPLPPMNPRRNPNDLTASWGVSGS